MTWVSRSSYLVQIPVPYELLGLPDPLMAAPDPKWFSIMAIEDAICMGLLNRAIGQFMASSPDAALFENQPPVEQRWIGNMR